MSAPRPATPDDRDEVATILAEAFTDDPLMVWTFPDDGSRPRLLQAMFSFLAEHLYLPVGASVIDDEGAAALWQPPDARGEDSESFWAEHGQGFVAALEGEIERTMVLGAAMAEHHPTERHWYLPAIGVRTAAHGRGLGGGVLRHTLAQVDAAGEVAYLEATTPRSAALYRRHGFEVTTEFTVDDSPPIWPMVRPAR
jgi:ribosomal protein S18 acetylase RimI-like enzyme